MPKINQKMIFDAEADCFLLHEWAFRLVGDSEFHPCVL
jgi:hypothetical protein